MTYETTDRGFKHLSEIVTPRQEHVRLYESSSVDASVWLRVTLGPGSPYDDDGAEAHAHLPLDQAEELRDQLSWLIANHFAVQPDG